MKNKLQLADPIQTEFPDDTKYFAQALAEFYFLNPWARGKRAGELPLTTLRAILARAQAIKDERKGGTFVAHDPANHGQAPEVTR